MAEFNITPGAVSPDNFLGYSRGIQTDVRNDALGDLFSGIAKFGEQAIEGINTTNVESIRNQIYEGVEDVQGEFGVDDATTAQKDADGKAAPAPPELASAQENLDRLQSAQQAGALKESHYWARLNVMVRQLRQKYPGYREEIDNMVRNVTGADPANALRSSLYDEWAANSANDPNKKYDDLVERAAFSGDLPADFQIRANDGNPYTMSELTNHVAQRNMHKADMAAEQAALSHLASTNQMNTDVAKRHFTMSTNKFVLNAINDMSSVLGRDYATARASIKAFQDAAAIGKPVDAKHMETVRAEVAQLRSNMKQALQAQRTESWDGDPANSYGVWMSPEESDAIIEAAMAPIREIEQALVDQNFGALNSIVTYTKAITDDAVRRQLDGIPILAEIAAMRQIMGPEGVSVIYGAKPEIPTALGDALLTSAMANAATNPSASVTTTIQDYQQRGAPQEVYSGMVDAWTNMADSIGNANVPPAVFSNYVDYMFGPDAAAVLQEMDDDSRFVYFEKVSSPRVTKKMMELREQGDLQSWENYQIWTTSQFITLFQAKTVEIQEASQSIFSPGIRVVWDDQNSGFRLLPGLVGPNPIPGAMMIGAGDNQRAAQKIKELNDVIRVMKPIIEDGTSTVGGDVYKILEGMGFDPMDQTDFLGSLMRALPGGSGSEAGQSDEP